MSIDAPDFDLSKLPLFVVDSEKLVDFVDADEVEELDDEEDEDLDNESSDLLETDPESEDNPSSKNGLLLIGALTV